MKLAVGHIFNIDSVWWDSTYNYIWLLHEVHSHTKVIGDAFTILMTSVHLNE